MLSIPGIVKRLSEGERVRRSTTELSGAGRTFVLEELTGGQQYVTETYREEKIRSDRLRVRQDDDTKIVNENSGILAAIN